MVEIEDTPFQIVGNEEKGYFVAFGKYRVGEVVETKEEALKYFNIKSWNIFINTITACIDIHNTKNTN